MLEPLLSGGKTAEHSWAGFLLVGHYVAHLVGARSDLCVVGLFVGLLLLAESVDGRPEELKTFWNLACLEAALCLWVEVGTGAGLSFLFLVFKDVEVLLNANCGVGSSTLAEKLVARCLVS